MNIICNGATKVAAYITDNSQMVPFSPCCGLLIATRELPSYSYGMENYYACDFSSTDFHTGQRTRVGDEKLSRVYGGRLDSFQLISELKYTSET